MNKECYSINGKEYYNLKQMFDYYKLFLSCEPAYNTFYKRFQKWQSDTNSQPVIVSGLKLYDKTTAESFIQEYDLVQNYSTSAKD